MANCTCRPEDIHSLSQLCESCTAEYLTLSEETEAADNIARFHGLNPEEFSNAITEEESHALALANAQDSYEPSLHSRMAQTETQLEQVGQSLALLTAATRSLVAHLLANRRAA